MALELSEAGLLVLGLQNLLLGMALWSAELNRSAARRLALALVVLTGMTSVHLLGWTGRADPPAHVAFFPLNLPLALGPLIYGYVHALVWGRAPRREPLHFAPAALHFLYLVTVLAAPEPARIAWKETVHDDAIKPLIEAAVLLSLGGYAVSGLLSVRRYADWLVRSRSDADRYACRWIRRVLGALLLSLAILATVRLYTWFVGELETGPLQLWLAAWGAWLGVEAWRHTERAFPVMRRGSDTTLNASGNDWAALGERWSAATEAAGWWREPDLTLSELARRLGTNTAYLSRAVNEGLGMNFNEFINRMRAQEVARRIQADPNEGDLLQMALEAGFSSKATFNRVFQAVFDTTPSAMRRRLRS